MADDAEEALLEHLAELKRAVAAGAEAAPDLHALRNVLAQIFEVVHLVRSGEGVAAVQQRMGDGVIPWHDAIPKVAAGQERYWLLLELRRAAVDEGWEPIRRELPVSEMEPPTSPVA